MEVVTNIPELRTKCAGIPRPVGFVPTMGYLHDGHLSLVQRAREECASVVVSIFVNPTQFAPNEDLDAYPRDIPRDLQLLDDEGVDVVWTPNPDVMYPSGYQTWVVVDKVTKPLEGIYRPAHFRGVTTVVAKLFNCVEPQKSYFGQKDAQQVVVIRRLVQDLNFSTEIVVCPIVREADGLAMSSRNVFLNPDERKAATVLYRSLCAAEEAFNQGHQEASMLRRIVIETINGEKLAKLQYISCANPDTLEELDGTVKRGLLSMAVYFGKTRLIDNILIGEPS